MRRPTGRFLWLLPPALGVGNLACAMGSTVYDSGGFESPRFTIGNLHGQDSGVSVWKESTTDPSGISASGAGTAAVQASGGGAGLGAQDVLVTRTQYDDRWAPSFSITPTTLNLVTISWNMLVNQTSGPTNDVGPFFGIEANDNTSGDKQIGALGVDATTGEVLVYDKTAGSFNTTPGDTSVTFGQFNAFTLTLDYQNSEYAVAMNGITLESGLSFFTSGATHFTDADIAALQAAASGSANQAGTAVFDNYLITNTTGQLPIAIEVGQTLTASSDAGIGASGAPVEFAGGTLAVNGSFSTSRSITVDSRGGDIVASEPSTLTFVSSSFTWAGGTLTDSGPGPVIFSLGTAAVSVKPGSTLAIADGCPVTVGGSVDPFTDSNTITNHVAISNNGSLAVNINSVIAGITGSGTLTIGNGSTANTLKLATGSGGSAAGSLVINGSSKLDITNNHLSIADPGGVADDSTFTTILGYLKTGQIISSAGYPNYGVGMVDGNDGVRGSLVSADTIEVAYTLNGDANLDGKVDASDFGIFAPNFGLNTTLGWEAGDFNYDGKVDASDFSAFAPNFGLQDNGTDVSLPAADYAALDAFAQANNLSLTSIPEPGSAMLLALAGAGILAGRRRKT
jgi:hypothetical protein